MDRPLVVVTGGSRGIGLATCARLLGAGYDVVAIARKTSAEFTALQESPAHSGRLTLICEDLSEVDRIPALATRLRQEFGSVYGLVNNAAVGPSAVLSNMRIDQIEETIRLNVLSPIVLTKHLVRSMMVARQGRVVNLSSIVANTGFSGLSVYAATKSAVIGFTKSLAREVGPLGITVNAVAPGFLATEMTTGLAQDQRDKIAQRSALKRNAEVGDIADAIEFLMSPRARNITGEVLTIDAGNTA